MSESPPTPAPERKRRADAPTSISTRVWVVDQELFEFRKLLNRHGDAALSLGALQLAQEKGEGGVDAYPGWLALGLAIRMARESIEARLANDHDSIESQNVDAASKGSKQETKKTFR